ncbi:MAG: 4Fe-4S binding protein [Methanobrevibacter sp.]|jgi:energy-converting hydrogenase A subunit P|nr:4Fe-4S binding protein [Candidatus Methanovirga basalitermitum]
MSSVIWYLYEFGRKVWVKGFFNGKTSKEIMEKPDRFRDFPKVLKKNCIGCGACTSSCPSPNAIKLIRDMDDKDHHGITYPVINKGACIRCGFCAEICPSEPKTLECGENHFITEKFNIVPSKRKFIVDDFLCIVCGKCRDACNVNAIEEINNRFRVNEKKCVACGDCLKSCPVKGAMKGIFINNLEEQKTIIKLIVDRLESFIENKKEELDKLDNLSLVKIQYPLSELWDEIIAILPDEEVAYEVTENAINRLKIRVMTWNEDNCKLCKLCVDECPTGAITYNEEDNRVKHDKNKCLRCSYCYQTCPFGVVKYFVVKFLVENNEENNNDKDINEIVKNKVIGITIKTSPLSAYLSD